MAEWLYEEGIGENRAALVEDGTIVEAAIEWPGELRAGTVSTARLTKILVPGRRAIVTLAGGGEALLEPVPAKLTEGAALTVEIVREAVPEAGRAKLAKARATEAAEQEGPSLFQRLTALGPVTRLSEYGEDRLEQAGWTELLEEALSGEIAFSGGALRMSLTPAMTLFDVDGSLDPAALAIAGADAAARTIRKFGIGGSIGIDLPTVPSKVERQKAAAAIDAALPQPFERTAVNGFGFLQIVRRRERASLPERLQGDPVGAAARALLRRAERSGQAGGCALQAAPPVVARLEANSDWLAALSARLGGAVALRAEPGLAISAGHVHNRLLQA